MFEGSQCLHLQGLKPDREAESAIILQNVDNYMPCDMVSHPRRLESSATPANPTNLPIFQDELCNVTRNIFRCEACLEDGNQHFKALVQNKVKLRRKNRL
jgi:hypothetical protein